MASGDEVLAAVLDLPIDERARIAHELLLSLGDSEVESDEGVAAEWADEIAKRAQAVDDGTAGLVDRSVVRRRILTRLQDSQ